MKSSEVLRTLRITRPTLTKYVKSGVIGVTTLPNGRYKYNKDDVYAFLNKDGDRKTYIYASTWEDEDGDSIDRQIAKVSEIMSQKNYEVSGMYIDEDCTTSIESRPEFTKLLDKVFDGTVKRIIITDLRRLSRTEKELLQYVITRNRCELIKVE